MFKKLQRDILNETIENNLDYLVRFAYFRVGNRTQSEDIVHDAVLKLLEKCPQDIKPESIRLYLFRIVQNLCMDKMREIKREFKPFEEPDVEDSTEEILDHEEADRINACLDSLPSREAEIIRMNVIDDLSFVEISSILSIPQSTAKSRYKSGMDKLRKLFTNN